MHTINRRAALVGLASLPAISSPGAASGPPVGPMEPFPFDSPPLPPETPASRCSYFAHALADELNEYLDGNFHAVIHPSDQARHCVGFVNSASVARQDAADLELRQAAWRYRRALAAEGESTEEIAAATAHLLEVARAARVLALW